MHLIIADEGAIALEIKKKGSTIESDLFDVHNDQNFALHRHFLKLLSDEDFSLDG